MNPNNFNILLVDKRVSQYEVIIAAIDPALAVGIAFDYYTDTYETIKVRIGEVLQLLSVGTDNNNNNSVVSVGLVQHNYKYPMFSMFAAESAASVSSLSSSCIIIQVETQDPELKTWTQFKDFIAFCKTEYGAAHFDLMACALYSDPNWKYVIDTLSLPGQTGVELRASTDDTGAAAIGGNWFLESHTGVNLKGVYFTELIEEYKGILSEYPFGSIRYSTKCFTPGRVITFGSGYAANSSSVSTSLESDVVYVMSTSDAFAALKIDGSVITWGHPSYGGDSSSVDLTNVKAIYSTWATFAALKNNGSVVTWGYNISYSSLELSSGIIDVYSSNTAFAALKSNGSVYVWGNVSGGAGANTAESVSAMLTSGVVALYYTGYAFAALKSDGSVVTWGEDDKGGDSISYRYATNTNNGSKLTSGVVALYATDRSFAALKSDGSVVTWGYDIYSYDPINDNYGGNTSSIISSLTSVMTICRTHGAFAALKTDGSVIVWGRPSYGGNPRSEIKSALTSNVIAIYSTYYTFAALKQNGTVVIWGENSNNEPSQGAKDRFYNIVDIYSGQMYFTILRNNGTVASTRLPYDGGVSGGGAFYPMEDYLDRKTGVVALYSIRQGDNAAFVENNGNVTTIDIAYNQFVGSEVNIMTVYTANYAYAAIKSTASTFDLSVSYYTDMDRFHILRKRENRRRVDLTTLNNNVFTLSQAHDIQTINPMIPADTILRIIVPDYISNPSINLTATLPETYTNYIIACDEHEAVTMSGATYVNYGSYVYKRETNNTFTKLVSATVSGNRYFLYGGNGTYSSGIALVKWVKPTPTFTSFVISTPKTNIDAPFAISAPISESNVAITYTSSDTSVATIDVNTGQINPVSAGTVHFIATQAVSDDWESATVSSNTLTVTVPSSLAGQTFSGSLAGKNFTNTSFVGATFQSGASLSGANLSGANFTSVTLTGVSLAGCTITGANLTNANIVGATNLPSFSTTQKLQLLCNTHNVDIGAIQITTPLSGSDINAAITSPVPEIASASFTVKAPTYNASNEKVISVINDDVAGNKSLYIPMNDGETVKINGVAYRSSGTDIFDADNKIIKILTILNKPYRFYPGSIALSLIESLNSVQFAGTGLYDIIIDIFALAT